ncbi:MAG: hypothetical protein AAB655_00720 [Patescibacteria group bacterium]
MAIVVVEEGKNKVNIVNVVLWFVVMTILGVAIYYIFFSRPELVEVVIPSNFKNVDSLATVNLDPNEVVSSKSFQSLKQYVQLPVPGNAGRSNPFMKP